MRFFGRRRSKDDVEDRCPHCGEPVPEEALACLMCGVDLKPLRGTSSDDGVDAANADSPAR
jgi:zinc-ribbon domain